MKTTRHIVAAAIAAVQSMPGWAQVAADKQALARIAKNPFADAISVPFVYDVNFGGGLGSKTQQVLNVQPIIPFDVSEDWSVITRTIVPLIAQPGLAGSSGARGLGDIQFAALLTPARVGRLDWGVGPVFQLRSASNPALGQGKWGVGPMAAAIWAGDQWTLGAKVNNLWSFAGERSRPNLNQMQFQPVATYFFRDTPGRYLTSEPTFTAIWKANGSGRWTVPLSLGIGQLVKFGNQPVDLQASASYTAIRPSDAAVWTAELQIQFLFQK
jgi:hypothetical protein